MFHTYRKESKHWKDWLVAGRGVFSFLGCKIGFLINILQITNSPLPLRLRYLFWPSHTYIMLTLVHSKLICTVTILDTVSKQKSFRNSVLAFTWEFQSDSLQQKSIFEKNQILSECLPVVFFLVKKTRKVCCRNKSRDSDFSLTCLHLEFHYSSSYSFVWVHFT